MLWGLLTFSRKKDQLFMLFHLPRFDHGHDSFFCLFFKEKMGLTDRLGTISRRHVGG